MCATAAVLSECVPLQAQGLSQSRRPLLLAAPLPETSAQTGETWEDASGVYTSVDAEGLLFILQPDEGQDLSSGPGRLLLCSRGVCVYSNLLAEMPRCASCSRCLAQCPGRRLLIFTSRAGICSSSAGLLIRSCFARVGRHVASE